MTDNPMRLAGTVAVSQVSRGGTDSNPDQRAAENVKARWLGA